MAQCPKPGRDSKSFKIEHIRPSNAPYSLPLVVRNKCGAAVGVSPEKIYDMLEDLRGRL
jgi:hypothetical protein